MIVTESSREIFALGASLSSTRTGTLFVHVITTVHTRAAEWLRQPANSRTLVRARGGRV